MAKEQAKPDWREQPPPPPKAQVRCKACGWQGDHARSEFSRMDPGFVDSFCPICDSGKLALVYDWSRGDVTASQELRDLVMLWRARLIVLDPHDHDEMCEREIIQPMIDALEERIGK
jgi:hypothetical protein